MPPMLKRTLVQWTLMDMKSESTIQLQNERTAQPPDVTWVPNMNLRDVAMAGRHRVDITVTSAGHAAAKIGVADDPALEAAIETVDDLHHPIDDDPPRHIRVDDPDHDSFQTKI